jgi:hypothetical protein
LPLRLDHSLHRSVGGLSDRRPEIAAAFNSFKSFQAPISILPWGVCIACPEHILRAKAPRHGRGHGRDLTILRSPTVSGAILALRNIGLVVTHSQDVSTASSSIVDSRRFETGHLLIRGFRCLCLDQPCGSQYLLELSSTTAPFVLHCG